MTDSEAIDECLKLLREYFKGDMGKVFMWLDCANALIGGVRPKSFILMGSSDKLLNFIQTAKDENKWGD